MFKLLSVVTVCYNEKDHIIETLNSVLMQNFTDYEYIILDGKSTDGTDNMIQNRILEEDVDKERIIFQSEKDNGIYDAMNKAIRMAEGQWILFLNAGDSFYNYNVLNTVEKYLRDKTIDIVYGDQCWQEEGNTYIRQPGGHEKLPNKVSIFHQSAFVRTTILKENLFSLRYKIAGDYESFLKLYVKGYRFLYVPVVIANFSYGGVSSTHPFICQKENREIRQLYGYFDNHDWRTLFDYYNQKIYLLIKMLLPRKMDLFLINIKRKLRRRSHHGGNS